MAICGITTYTASLVRITTPTPIRPTSTSSSKCPSYSSASDLSRLANVILRHLNTVQVPDPILRCPAGCTCDPRGHTVSLPVRSRRFRGTITFTRRIDGQPTTCTYRVDGTVNLGEKATFGICDCPGTFELPRSSSSGGSSEYKKSKTKKQKTTKKKKIRKSIKKRKR